MTVPCRAAAGDPYDALVELIPDRFAAGGEAIARDADGRVVFVNGALPGERVRVEITEHKRDWARARVVEIIDASPHRVRPPCPSRRAGCGGCGWQHMTHDAQRDAKRAVAADALTRIGGLPDADVRLGASVDPVGYRTTVRVAATADGRAGFRAEHTHDVVAAPDCLVAHPLLRRAIAALELAPEVEPTLRCSVATGELGARWEGAGELVRGLPDGALVGGREALHETVAGTTLRVSMGSFFQSGPQAAELLVDTVRQGRARAVGGRGRGRRLCRHRVVRRPRRAGGCPRDRRRDVEVGRRRRRDRTSPVVTSTSSAARSVGGTSRRVGRSTS